MSDAPLEPDQATGAFEEVVPPDLNDPFDAALLLLKHVRDTQTAAEESGGHVQMPAPSDVANLYARAQVYAVLALCERIDGLIRMVDEASTRR